jgi:SAM-dependent methyltransferase
MERGYQFGFSRENPAMFDADVRGRKARTMIAVLEDHFGRALSDLDLVNVGTSTGIIDHVLARHLRRVVGIDIDELGVEHAKRNFSAANLEFRVGDAMNMPFADASFDVAICSQVYEHVPDARVMFDEIHRVLRPGGVCYFAASNRLMINEPHYNLPFLALLPRPLADLYLRLTGRGTHYYEKHLTYWGLRRLVHRFRRLDYTERTVCEAERFHTAYMVRPGTTRARIAAWVVRNALWACPGYIWVLEKPARGNS